MKRFLFLLALLGLVSHRVSAAHKPNIIVILADDLGWGDLSCYPKGEAWGDEAKVATPNIDALAASGVRCTQGYATCMVCSPSRAALLSGQYQQRFGFYGFGEANVPFPTRLKLLPETLREDGYSTAMAGKWHISFAPESTPLKRGFDRFFGLIGGQHDYFDAGLGQPMHGVSNAADAFLKDQEKNVEHIKYLTDELTDRALGFLGEARKQPRPFFLYLPYNAPHPPMQAAWQDLEPFAKLRPKERFNSRDIARAMIANLDANVGRVMRWLHENDLEKNTLVFFTSDNGGADDGPGHVTQHNGGLRGRKGYFYEGGIRIPYIVSWPGTLPAGATFEQPVSHLDIYATAAAVAGHARTEDLHLDGVNLIPHLTLKDTSAPHARMFWSVQTPLRWAVREGDWKLVREDLTPTLLQLRSPSKFKLQLYNITEDRNETHDLAEEKLETVARMQKLFDGFLAQSQPTTFTPAVNAANKAAVAARAKNPALREHPRSDGAPGHWIGGGAKERLAKEQAGE